ncbi:MAG TPA: glycosyltransferase family 4 protein [Alphaproteobacteria bacterium]|nr:glycosyltransferase family 4 protein [Alphaproteobacteria bacterium]
MDLGLSARDAALGLVFFLATAASTWIVTRWVIAMLTRRQILDSPNARSSHAAPTPRGGGLGVLGIALPLLAAVTWLHWPADAAAWAVLGGALVLAVVSWADDLKDISSGLRLAAHAAAVALALALLPSEFTLFQGALPLIVDRVLAAIAWVWFVNLFNFMDGIDGIAGVETIAIGLGMGAAAMLIGGPGGAATATAGLWGFTLAAGATGFLVLNWHPARVFLGDVGSVPLGFLLGWLLISLAHWGYWAAALILPAYYLADATLTLAFRLLRGQRIWEAHKEHFYQRAVARGWSHDRVAWFIAKGNAMLLVLAAVSTQVLTGAGDALCVIGAAIIVAVMLAWLARAVPPEGEAGQ